jgi:hypothetical protein
MKFQRVKALLYDSIPHDHMLFHKQNSIFYDIWREILVKYGHNLFHMSGRKINKTWEEIVGEDYCVRAILHQEK